MTTDSKHDRRDWNISKLWTIFFWYSQFLMRNLVTFHQHTILASCRSSHRSSRRIHFNIISIITSTRVTKQTFIRHKSITNTIHRITRHLVQQFDRLVIVSLADFTRHRQHQHADRFIKIKAFWAPVTLSSWKEAHFTAKAMHDRVDRNIIMAAAKIVRMHSHLNRRNVIRSQTSETLLTLPVTTTRLTSLRKFSCSATKSTMLTLRG